MSEPDCLQATQAGQQNKQEASRCDSPKAGDIIIIDFNPQSGHEIQKRRPALVVSNDSFNRITGMAVVCPITSTRRDIPYHVSLDSSTVTQGEILCEQAKSLDYESRGWYTAEVVPDKIFNQVIDILEMIIGK